VFPVVGLPVVPAVETALIPIAVAVSVTTVQAQSPVALHPKGAHALGLSLQSTVVSQKPEDPNARLQTPVMHWLPALHVAQMGRKPPVVPEPELLVAPTVVTPLVTSQAQPRPEGEHPNGLQELVLAHSKMSQ
jgi:hypothetical protein